MGEIVCSSGGVRTGREGRIRPNIFGSGVSVRICVSKGFVVGKLMRRVDSGKLNALLWYVAASGGWILRFLGLSAFQGWGGKLFG